MKSEMGFTMKLKEELEILKSIGDLQDAVFKMILSNHPKIEMMFWQETFKLQGTGKKVDFDKILANIE